MVIFGVVDWCCVRIFFGFFCWRSGCHDFAEIKFNRIITFFRVKKKENKMRVVVDKRFLNTAPFPNHGGYPTESFKRVIQSFTLHTVEYAFIFSPFVPSTTFIRHLAIINVNFEICPDNFLPVSVRFQHTNTALSTRTRIIVSHLHTYNKQHKHNNNHTNNNQIRTKLSIFQHLLTPHTQSPIKLSCLCSTISTKSMSTT